VIVDNAVVKGKLLDVFRFMGNFANSVRWDPGVKSAVRNELGKLGQGSSFTLVTVFKGKESLMTYEVTKWEPPVGNGKTATVELKGEGATIYAYDTILLSEAGDSVKIDYKAELTLKSFRRPFIGMVSKALDQLGRDAMTGIENFYKYGSKAGTAVESGSGDGVAASK